MGDRNRREKSELLAMKQKQKLEMLQALGHCNEVVGRMLYNAEIYFKAITNSNNEPIYNGYQTTINPSENESLLEIKMRLLSQMQNSLNIIKLFNMNSHKFGEKFENLNTNESNLILNDIDNWIAYLKKIIDDRNIQIQIQNQMPQSSDNDNLVMEKITNEINECFYCIHIYNKIKEIIKGDYKGSFYEEIARLREINKKTNKNFRERKTKDMMAYAPYVAESTNDIEEDIKNEYNKKEDYVPKVRRGQNSSTNKINNYEEEIKIMKRIHEYREKAFNEICPHDRKNKKMDCSHCVSLIDKISGNMSYD